MPSLGSTPGPTVNSVKTLLAALQSKIALPSGNTGTLWGWVFGRPVSGISHVRRFLAQGSVPIFVDISLLQGCNPRDSRGHTSVVYCDALMAALSDLVRKYQGNNRAARNHCAIRFPGSSLITEIFRGGDDRMPCTKTRKIEHEHDDRDAEPHLLLVTRQQLVGKPRRSSQQMASPSSLLTIAA